MSTIRKKARVKELNLKKIIINNIRDLSIFAVFLYSDIFKDIVEQVIGALLIVLINSLVIPLLKELVKYVKQKINNKEIEKIIDDTEKEIVDMLEDFANKNKDGDNDDKEV